jgi:putative ABC transport system substrate-binding protein
MNRRAFFLATGGAAAMPSLFWPGLARAQSSERIRTVGVLNAFGEHDPESQANMAAFRQALQKAGWNEGRNLRVEQRWGDADPERIRVFAIELVALKPDVILVSSALALQPLIRETRTIPTVFVQMADPVASGFVPSFAQPGGNLTGFTVAEFSTFAKMLEVLKEVAPRVARAAVILNPDQAPQSGIWHAIEAAAPAAQVQVTPAAARDAAELERAIDQSAREPNGGLIVLPNPVTIGNRKLIIDMAARYRLPAAYAFRSFVDDGGLISYGVDLPDQYRQAAAYVDRILRGEKPAALPVQQPTKFELVVNLKTAKALGLDVPWILQQRADDVIE